MVGHPKHLSDLRKLGVNTRLAVRCRSCRHQRILPVGPLTAELVSQGANLAWSELPRALPCPCGSADVSVAPYVFVEPGPSLPPPSRAGEPLQRGVTLALAVLNGSATRAGTQACTDAETRLALWLLWQVLREREALTAFWAKCQARPDPVWENARRAWPGILKALRDEGWDAPADFCCGRLLL